MKLLSKIFPQNEFIGIHFGYKNSHITVGSCVNGTIKVEWHKEFSDSIPANFNKAELAEYFTELFSSLPNDFKKRYLPIQVALPDPLFKTQKMQFSNFPGRFKQQYSLVKWQLAKESHCNVDELAVSWQILKQQNLKQNLFAYGLDKNIVEALKQATKESGLQVSLINAASYYRYNLLDTEALGDSGVLLSLEKEYWTLMFWDENGDLSHICSSIREHDTENNISNIVAEAERLVWSYVQQQENITQIYITSTYEEKELLETQINLRLENKCKWLAIHKDSNVQFNNCGLVDLATIHKL